jgi:lambda family phage portal protein
VRKDRFGRPITYFLYRNHPGNHISAGVNYETIAVAAASMMHIKFARRLHQTRGASIFHSVLTRLDDLKDYEESERVAARVAAAFTAYIKRGNDYDPTIFSGDAAARTMEMAPGMVFDNLLPGEEVGTIDASRPNNDVGNYIAIQERRIAAGTGSRRSAIGRDYNGTYSSQRQELVEGAVHYRRLFSYLTHKFYLPVWRRFVDQARLAGLLRVSRDVDLRTLYRPELRQQPLPWIDPRKEIEAHALAVEHGFKSRHQVIRDLGGDPREVDAQLLADTLDIRPAEEADADPGRPADDEDNDTDESADDEDDEMEDAA